MSPAPRSAGSPHPIVAAVDVPGQAVRLRVAMLVRTWPKLSETFILEEVLGLERLGVDLRLYAIAKPADASSHEAVARVRAPLVEVPTRATDVGARHVEVARAKPLAYARTMVRTLVETIAAKLRGRRSPWQDFLRAGWLAAQLKRDGIGHLHVHFISDTADVARLAARMVGMPYSISAHAKDIYLSAASDLRRKLVEAAFTVTCTEANRRVLASIAPEARVHLMYHGIDRDVFHPARRLDADSTTSRPAAAPLLLAVGRLREKKGLDTLIDACRLLHARGVAVACDIVGYGEARDALARRIDEAGLDGHVRLLGKLTREHIVACYARAAVFVQPSRIAADGDRDGIPNVLLEAMAMTLPVVATRVSGIPELVIDGTNGLLVEPDAPEELADAIERLLREPRLASALGQAARITVTEGFDNDRNLRLLIGLFDKTARASVDASGRTALSPVSVPIAEAASFRAALPAGSATVASGANKVAYVMNGFPRLSETFIAHEIHQLERMGTSLRLYSVKDEREPFRHPVVEALRSPLVYLPEVGSLSGTNLPRWLRENTSAYRGAHGRVFVRRPWAWVATLATALVLAWRHRPRDPDRPFAVRKVFVKEFVQAGWIADTVRREGDVTHLHGHFCHGVATITWFASRMSGLPFSFTAHAKDIYQAELNPGRLLERKLGAARFVATCTCANAQVLRARHPRPDEVHAIYHGLDTDWFSPRPATNARVGPPLLLAVGRLVEKKGFDGLIEACGLLRDRGVPFEARILGEEGSAGSALRAQVDRLRLAGHVRFVGPMAQGQLREVYRDASLFALPCRVMADGDRDGFPNVLAEAMAMGVPVVTTPISGIPEMIDDGVHGLLVDGSPASLADAIERLLGDDALRASLATAARQRICERFDSRRTTAELRDLFARSLTPLEIGLIAASSRGAAA